MDHPWMGEIEFIAMNGRGLVEEQEGEMGRGKEERVREEIEKGTAKTKGHWKCLLEI